jgi:hypothetical protein
MGDTGSVMAFGQTVQILSNPGLCDYEDFLNKKNPNAIEQVISSEGW